MTCYQCIHSMGGLIRHELYCRLHMRRCDFVCPSFEREPGTEEPDGTE